MEHGGLYSYGIPEVYLHFPEMSIVNFIYPESGRVVLPGKIRYTKKERNSSKAGGSMKKNQEKINVSAGRIGYQVETALEDLKLALRFELGDLTE